MGTQDRREREKQELRNKILDAARALFVEQGFDSVSMRKIAEAIEYSPTALYFHFKDKQELMTELCRRDFGALAQRAVELRQVADPIERIAALGRGYIRFALEHPNHYRLMFMTPFGAHIPQPTDEDLKNKNDPTQSAYAVLRHAVNEAIAAKRFKAHLNDDVELIVQTFWAAVHGVASLQIAKANDPWIDWAPLDKRIDVMVDGILSALTTDERKGGRKHK